MQKRLWLRFLVINAFRNLLRAPRRTVFTLLAIAGAACSLMLFRSFVDGVKATFRHNIITSDFAQYQIYRKGYREHKGDDAFAYLIPDEQSKAVRDLIAQQIAPLAFLSRQIEFYGLVSHNGRTMSARGIGTDPKEDQKFLTLNRVIQGKHLAEGTPNNIFLGKGLAHQLGVTVGDVVTVLVSTAQGSINARDLDVVGIFQTGVEQLDDSTYYLYQQTAKDLLRVAGASKLLLAFNTDNELPYQARLRALIQSRFPDLEVVHWHELAGSMYDNSISWLESIFIVFDLIILFIASLSILNVFSINLLERTGEFGTLRAIGTYRKEIVAIIFAESILQSLIGALVGLGLGVFAIVVLLRSGIWMPPPMMMNVPFHVQLLVPWKATGLILGLCVLVAGGSGVFPAIRISRANITEALGRNV